jgi:hypothetical protein
MARACARHGVLVVAARYKVAASGAGCESGHGPMWVLSFGSPGASLCPAILDRDIATFDPAEFA